MHSLRSAARNTLVLPPVFAPPVCCICAITTNKKTVPILGRGVFGKPMTDTAFALRAHLQGQEIIMLRLRGKLIIPAAAAAAAAAVPAAATAPAAAPAPFATRDLPIHRCCPRCFTMCVSSSLLPSALLGIVSGWAGGDTRSV